MAKPIEKFLKQTSQWILFGIFLLVNLFKLWKPLYPSDPKFAGGNNVSLNTTENYLMEEW